MAALEHFFMDPKGRTLASGLISHVLSLQSGFASCYHMFHLSLSIRSKEDSLRFSSGQNTLSAQENSRDSYLDVAYRADFDTVFA